MRDFPGITGHKPKYHPLLIFGSALAPSSLVEFPLKPFAIVFVLFSASASLPALANLELAQKSACTACHAVDKKVVGPSYQDIAKKYASQKDAIAIVSESIRKGGSGKWGPVPMPAQPALSDADVKTLAAWVLGGGK